MKITTENTLKKHYIELLPTITVSLKCPHNFSVGWLWWFVFIDF